MIDEIALLRLKRAALAVLIGSVLTVGGALVLGALLRLVLTTRRAGLLRVRSKAFDVGVMLLAGGAILVLSVIVPAGR